MERSIRGLVIVLLLLSTASATGVAASAESSPDAESVRLEGRVLGPDGPLRGVRVLAAAESAPDGWSEDAPRFAITETGDGGAFELSITGEPPLVVFARAGGFAPHVVVGHDPVEGELLIRLGEGLPLSGVVADLGSGEPLSGARVAVRIDGVAALVDAGAEDEVDLVQTTGDDGLYAFEHVAPGRVDVRASAPGRDVETLRHTLTRDSVRSQTRHLTLAEGSFVEGVVLDPDDAPVAGARVRIAPADPALQLKRIMGWARTAGRDTETRSDEGGRFRVEGFPLLDSYELLASAEGFADAVVSPVSPATRDIEVRLRRGGSVAFALVDAEGVAFGAPVRVRPAPADDGAAVSWFGGAGRGVETIEPDGEGLYTVEHLVAGEYQLFISPEGYIGWPEDVTIVDGEQTDLGELPLPSGDELRGRVVDDLGDPVAGADVMVITRGPGRRGRTRVETDGQGRFAIGGFGAQGFVVAKAEGHGDVRERVEDPLSPLSLVLPRQGGVRGRAIRVDFDRGADAFEVNAVGQAQGDGAVGPRRPRRRRSPIRAETKTQEFVGSERGRFEIDDLVPGTYAFVVTAPGCLPARLEGVEVRAGETTDLGLIELAPGTDIEGLVLSRETGAPVVGAAVSRQQGGAVFSVSRDEATADATTGPEGRFLLEGLPPGPLPLVVSHEHHAPQRVEIEIVPGEPPPPLVVELGPGGTLEGVAHDESGAPIPQAMIFVTDGRDRSSRTIANADEQGRFRFEHLAPGNYLVVWMKVDPRSGFSDRQPPQQRTVTIESGRTTALAAREASRKLLVRGRILRGDEPLGEARTYWSPVEASLDTPTVTADADAAGRYQVELPRAGAYRVSIFEAPRDDRPRRRVGVVGRLEVDVSETLGDIDLQIPESALRGTVRLAETGEAPESATVLPLTRNDEGQIGDASRYARYSEGSFSIEGLPEGEYHLLVFARGMAAEILEPIDLGPGDVVDDIDVLLTRSHQRTVELRTVGGEPIAGVRVVPLGRGESIWAYTSLATASGADGRAVLDSLPDGLWDLAIGGSRGALTVLEDVEVGPEATGALRVTPERAGRLILTALSAQEQPLAGARLSIRVKDGRDLTPLLGRGFVSLSTALALVSGDNGRLELDILPEGVYEVEVRSPDGASAKTEVRITAGETAEETLELR